MPVAFFAGRVLLLHPLRVLVEGFDFHGIAVMEFSFDNDLEDRLALLLDLVRDCLRDQIERDALDLLGRRLPACFSSVGIGSHLADLIG